MKIPAHERMLAFDTDIRNEYGSVIVGCDECGRGSWAGPIAAGGCILPPNTVLPGLNDSKVMSAAKREELAALIKEVAWGWSVVFIEPIDIDKYGLTWANKQAMLRASQNAAIMAGLPVSVYLIDQAPSFSLNPHKMFPKADSLSLSVAAAACLAKTTRDKYMEELAQQYPGYGWETSKGYIQAGTVEAVNKLGLIRGIHRFSYNVKGLKV